MFRAAIIGSGNIGTDLMYKIDRLSETLQMAVMVGIDPASEGLSRARELGVQHVDTGLDGLVAMDVFADIDIVFDATSAQAHLRQDAMLARYGKQVVDLTPAAIGPFVVPLVNLDDRGMPRNVNMVTCGGQATIPIVAAVNVVAKVHCAEIVASIASRSAEPPMMMRDTIYCLCDEADTAAIEASVAAMVTRVQTYVPGYRLKQRVQQRGRGTDAARPAGYDRGPGHAPGFHNSSRRPGRPADRRPFGVTA